MFHLDYNVVYFLEESTTTGLLLFHGRRYNNCTDGLVKDTLESFLCQGRAFHEFHCVDLLRLGHSLLEGDGCLVLLAQTIDGIFVVAEIEFSAD